MTPLLHASQVGIAGRFHPADLDARDGQVIALIGPNGGGKTSLLRALARVDGALGCVSVDGADIDAMPINRRRKMLSFLTAGHDAAWPVPVRDYVALSGADSDAIDRRLEEFELDMLAQRPVDELSTGERSRVMLARAIAPRPRLLLLDEPLSNLEPYWVLRLLEMLRHEAGRGAAVLCSLHDLQRLDAFDRALMIAGGQVVADGPPATVTAQPEFSAIFRVSLNGGTPRVTRRADPRS